MFAQHFRAPSFFCATAFNVIAGHAGTFLELSKLGTNLAVD